MSYSTGEFQTQLYESLFTNFNLETMENVTSECTNAFGYDICHDIFRGLIINIFYTLTLYLRSTKVRNKISRRFFGLAPITPIYVMPIKDSQVRSIIWFCDLMQDHSYLGAFHDAYLATLLKTYITQQV